MTDADAPPDGGEATLQDLARAYLDLWQDHAALSASDPKIAEQWQEMFRHFSAAGKDGPE